MRSTELIIFDLDGTLVDSREDIARGVNFTLKSIGLGQKPKEEIISYVGRGVEDLLKRALGDKNSGLFDKSLSIFKEYYLKHSTDNSTLYPGVKETLEYLKEKRKVIITNRRYEFAAVTLKALGIDGYFQGIIGGDNLGCMKPSSCPLDKALCEFKIENPKDTMIVGDMDIDIIAGKKAGVVTCAVTYGIGKREDILRVRPDYIIDHIAELKKIIVKRDRFTLS